MTARCLVVGWDGADRGTVEEMLGDGALPALARLRSNGASGRIEALAGLADDAHWASFSTGLQPGVHGRFHHRQTDRSTGAVEYFRRTDMVVPPFWDALASAGRRVAVVDVPKSPMSAAAHCRQLVDWMPHGEDGDRPTGTPIALINDFVSRYPSIRYADCHRSIPASHLASYCETLLQRVATRHRLLDEWIRDDDWDLFLAVFAESHCVGHHARGTPTIRRIRPTRQLRRSMIQSVRRIKPWTLQSGSLWKWPGPTPM